MRNYTVTSVWGIPIRLNVSLLVFLPVLVWLIGSGGQIALYRDLIDGVLGVAIDPAALQAGATPWVIGVAAAVGLFVSVTLHELGHSWVALRYDLEIESITLWILGGIASIKALPREWNREFWIAIAGPITSVLVGGIAWAGVLALPASLPVLRFVLGWLAIVNLILAAFNLLPAFPMDGGRILRALLARNRSYASATQVAARFGVAFALVFAVVGVLSFNVILVLLALFVYGAAKTESRTVLLDELLTGLTVADVMARDLATIPRDATVSELAERVLRDRQTVYPVTDAAGDVVGVVTLDDLRGVSPDARDTTAVESVMQTPLRVGAVDDAFDAFAALSQASTSTALVESDGQITGVLTTDDFSRALTVQREFRTHVAQ